MNTDTSSIITRGTQATLEIRRSWPEHHHASSTKTIKPSAERQSLSGLDAARESARVQNIPVRSGKWNHEEEDYLRKLVELFCLGVLDEVEQKSSMRAWLSRMLNCCPMRISKKQMNGEKFIGKAKFTKNHEAISTMTQEQYDESCDQVHHLRFSFLKHWAKDEFARRTTKDKPISFDEWYSKVLSIVPHPKIAKNHRIVETKRRPEPEPMSKVREQIQETRAKERRRSADPPARSYKRQRSEVFNGIFGEHTLFQDMLNDCVTPCESPDAISMDNTFGANSHAQTVEDSWMLEICAEAELSLGTLNECVEVSHTIQLLPSEEPTPVMPEPEDEFQRKEILTPEHASGAHFDFGLPSKWDCYDAQDLSSRESAVWEDNELLDDGFALLMDPSLMLWDDSENPLDNTGHSALASCMPTLHL
ncbi:hypothetical protein Gpo141_00001801 [Globisporangium polare]